jgi:RNA:NAD 2'-phosphotransferase (TPT1/KptA family)
MTTLTRDQVRVSRRISMVLRHRPESAGLTLDDDRSALTRSAVVRPTVGRAGR